MANWFLYFATYESNLWLGCWSNYVPASTFTLLDTMGLYKSTHDNDFLTLTEGWNIVIIVLVHVDDLLVFATPTYMRWLHTSLEERFGKMKRALPPLVFCGIAHEWLSDVHLFCHQQHYLEKLKPIIIDKNRVKQEQSSLKPKEHFDFR